MSAMIGLCSNKQIHLLQEKLDERFPTDRIDFTRDLPRTLALRFLFRPRVIRNALKLISGFYRNWIRDRYHGVLKLVGIGNGWQNRTNYGNQNV